jgi:hypothetical protein
VSKERARRRLERQAAQAVAAAKRARRRRWRSYRWALLRRLARLARLVRPGRRRAWLLGRRRTGQRVLLACVALGLLWTVWFVVGDVALRVAFSLLVLFMLPVLAALAFDRRR